MKINTNIPIFIILTLFIGSNAVLYQYLNDGYFIDKKPETPIVKVENVIFRLIQAHEEVLNKRNEEILLEAERLRNIKLTITDSAELKAIEEKLKALEAESVKVLELVKNSENEKKAALRKSENDQVQLTELMKINNNMGMQLEEITTEFENYVETLEDTLKSNSFSEKDISEITLAFKNKNGLDYVNNLVGNIQKNRASLNTKFTEILNNRSTEYHNGLKSIARILNDNNYIGLVDDKGLLETNESIENLKLSLNRYITTKDRNNLKKLNSELQTQEDIMLLDLETQLKTLQEEEDLKLQISLEEQLKTQNELKLYELELAQQEKELSLIELEKKLRNELEKKQTTIEIDLPAPDRPTYTNWIHIPGIWESTSSSLTFSGKKIDTVAWSKSQIEDNQIITFNGEFKENAECILILFGNGRFKNLNDGLIITFSNLGPGRILLNITKNGIDENSEVLFTNSFSLENGINGDYNLQIVNGKLSIYLSAKELLINYDIDIEKTGRIGFANMENNSSEFNISNIKLYNIR